MEIYRYLIDDFLLGFCWGLSAQDFVLKSDFPNRNKKGKHEYLESLNFGFGEWLGRFFNSKVDIPRIKVEKNRVETLITKEALLFTQYPRKV